MDVKAIKKIASMCKSSTHIIILLVFLATYVSCKQSQNSRLEIPFSKQEIRVDGIISKNEWKTNEFIEGLTDPWETFNTDQTRFKTFRSSNYFNFCFQVIDSTIVSYDFEGEITVAKEDRVELFFSTDTTLSNYYCIEIDPLGRILDYSAKHYRKFNERWDFKTTEVGAIKTETGYIVEGRISLDELSSLGIKNEFNLGVFRADFTSENKHDVNWYSWIEPNSTQPDFHIPTAFGKIKMK